MPTVFQRAVERVVEESFRDLSGQLNKLTIHTRSDASTHTRPCVLEHEALCALRQLLGGGRLGGPDVPAQLACGSEEDVGLWLSTAGLDLGRVGGQDTVRVDEGEELGEVGLTSAG